MRIVLLGSEGQIGKPLAAYLTAKGHKVRGFDLNGPKREDLRFHGALEYILKKYDFCFFLAFDVGGSTYLAKHQQTKAFLDNNMKIMLFTFETLAKWRVPFVFASSQMSNMAHSPYGLLKAIGEHYTRTLDGLFVRFWNVYGLEKDDGKSHVISDFIRMAMQGRVRMMTDGSEQRQFLYVDDCCRALETIMLKWADIPREQALHVTSFQWHSIMTVATIIAKMNNAGFTMGEQRDSQSYIKNQPERDILKYWEPKISLEDGIKRVWDAMLTEQSNASKVPT